MSERLLPAVEAVRNHLGEIRFVGLWWDAPPAWAADVGAGSAFRVEPGRLRELGIRTLPPVAYRDVIPSMSSAQVNIMTQRRYSVNWARDLEIFRDFRRRYHPRSS